MQKQLIAFFQHCKKFPRPLVPVILLLAQAAVGAKDHMGSSNTASDTLLNILLLTFAHFLPSHRELYTLPASSSLCP